MVVGEGTPAENTTQIRVTVQRRHRAAQTFRNALQRGICAFHAGSPAYEGILTYSCIDDFLPRMDDVAFPPRLDGPRHGNRGYTDHSGAITRGATAAPGAPATPDDDR